MIKFSLLLAKIIIFQPGLNQILKFFSFSLILIISWTNFKITWVKNYFEKDFEKNYKR